MSSIKLSPNASGTGALTIAAPNTNTDVTFNLGTALGNNGASALVSTDNAGNLGLGVTPSAWNSGAKFAQLGSAAALGTYSGATVLYHNSYVDSAGTVRYLQTGPANSYQNFSGLHAWFTAPSGTAGNAISFTQAMTLDASGNLGVGTTSPQVRLHVETSSGNYQMRIGSSTSYYEIGRNTTDGLLYFTGNQNGFNGYVFGGVNGERARIDSSGRILAGVISPITGNFYNFVNGSAETSMLVVKNSGTAAHLPFAIYNNASSGDNSIAAFFVNSSPATVGSIDFNRGAGLTRYNTTSDATLKNILGDADSSKSAQILSATRIREYAWKDDPSQKPQIGVIAQELYETFKGAVSVGGEQDDGKYRAWGVDKTAFTFHLVAGWQAHEKIIQEQQAIIAQQSLAITAQAAALESLTARITALEAA